MSATEARVAVRRAIEAGRLVPPDTCGRCEKAGPQSSDGRRTIQAHHHKGYSRDVWLDVEWVCPKCHFVDDPRPSGQNNGRAKLTREQAVEIRKSTERGTVLATRYGVSTTAVSRARRGVNWSILNEEPQ